jgi:hypothetical protein
VRTLRKDFKNIDVTTGQSNVITVEFINDMVDYTNGFDRNVFFDGILMDDNLYKSVPGCRISYSGKYNKAMASEYQKGSFKWGGKYLIDIGSTNSCGALAAISEDDLSFNPPSLAVSVNRWLAKSVSGSTGQITYQYKIGCSDKGELKTSDFTLSSDGDKRIPLVKIEAMYAYMICPVGTQLRVLSGSTDITDRLTNEDGSPFSLGNEKIVKFWDIPTDANVANITPDFKIDPITNSNLPLTVQGHMSSITQTTTLSLSCNFGSLRTTVTFGYTLQAQTIPALSVTNNNALPCSYGKLKGTLQITSNPTLQICKVPSAGSTLTTFNPSTDTQLYFGTC